MLRYVHRSKVTKSIGEVVAFHGDSRVLKELTPPIIITSFHHVEPIADGSIVDFTMWLGLIPIRWVSIHSDIHKEGFTDTQIRGPFSYWRHRHTFRPIDQKTTEVIDEIWAELGSHPFWGLVSRFMWLNLPILFGYRGWKIRHLIERARI